MAMDREQEQQIVDFYSTKDRYIKNKVYSNRYEAVYTKENNKYEWLVLEQKGNGKVEARQTDREGRIIAWDSYDVTKGFPECTSMERVQEGGTRRIPFTGSEIALLSQMDGRKKEEICASLSACLARGKDAEMRRLVDLAIKKLGALSGQGCAELMATARKRAEAGKRRSVLAQLNSAKQKVGRQENGRAKQQKKNRHTKDMEI